MAVHLELSPLGSEILKADLKSLELLFDYTKFHIGVYLTLASSFITVASLKRGDDFALPTRRGLVILAMLLFMLAGLAGGVIVSEITQCYGIDRSPPVKRCTSTREFLAADMGPWDGTALSLKGRQWTYVEHTAFWAGLLSALGAFLFPGNRDAAPKKWKPPPKVTVAGTVAVKNSEA